jgi:CheY-like chemotaxis protein
MVKNIINILVVDDEQSILNLYSKALEVIDHPAGSKHKNCDFEFNVTYCQDGKDAIEKFRNAQESEKPYAVAFLDVRLPASPDGVWVGRKLREMSDFVHIVIVTAYSDFSRQEILGNIEPSHRLMYVQKPFHLQEIKHIAHTLSEKWILEQNEDEKLDN